MSKGKLHIYLPGRFLRRRTLAGYYDIINHRVLHRALLVFFGVKGILFCKLAADLFISLIKLNRETGENTTGNRAARIYLSTGLSGEGKERLSLMSPEGPSIDL